MTRRTATALITCCLLSTLPGRADPTHPTLTNGVFCGYQGWFACEGDGSNRGWFHWTKKPGRPGLGNVNVDLWPDLSELDPADRFDTDFKHGDGRTAQVFSSYRRDPVLTSRSMSRASRLPPRKIPPRGRGLRV